MNESQVRESLQKEKGPADWALLQPHYESGAIVFVDPSLDLIDVAVRMHQDDSNFIKKQMTDFKLYKVDEQNVERIQENTKVFSCVVVAPFVLIQP